MKNTFVLLLSVFAFCFVSISGYAANPRSLTDLKAGLQRAKAENKMLFIQYGREACGNCKHLKKMIKNGRLKLSKKDFVYVDLDCDDSESKALFKAHYDTKGRMLPFVVIAGPDGKRLAERTGYGDLPEYKTLIRKAKVRNKERLRITSDSSKKSDQSIDGDKKVKTVEDIRKSLGM